MSDLGLVYAGGLLDRAGARRKDDAWVAAALDRDDAVIIPVCGDRMLVADADDGRAAGRCTLGMLRALDVPSDGWTVLGVTSDDVPVVALSIADTDGARIADALPGGELADLRRAGPIVPAGDAALLAYARAMLVWHRRHRHCGVCGSATESRQAGHMRRCTRESCGAETYPRTDPAVIMLVERELPNGERVCLLGRHGRLPPGAFSTLAGFVEPGESLEEAVAREVLEETGVRVSSASYVASQPWPFPASLMIGFRATAATEAIDVDPDEIEEARWFTAAELRAAGEWGDDGAGLKLPRRDSIARMLLSGWLGEQSA